MNFTEWKKAYQQATGRIEPKPVIKPKEEESKKTKKKIKTTKKTNMKKKDTKTVKID